MASSARMAFRYYPHPFLLPDGRIVVTGEDDRAVDTRVLNLTTQSWTTVDARVLDGHSSVMYAPGKISEGWYRNSGRRWASVGLDLLCVQHNHAAVPCVASDGSNGLSRSFLNLTVLPDGQVLATGGGRTTTPDDLSGAVYQAELWSPLTKTWTTMARMQTPRLYHSTALLLPDARVLVAGGGRAAGASSGEQIRIEDQPSSEIYSPPYLFKGPRPVIASAPGVIPYAADFPIATSDASRIASVSLIPLGAVTHSFNENQRFVPLAFQAGSASLQVTGPVNGNTAPPGPYMLFIVDSSGVPSVAAMVRLPAPGESASNTPPTISTLSSQTIDEDSATGALTITVGDAETAAASLTMSGSSSIQPCFPSGTLSLVAAERREP